MKAMVTDLPFKLRQKSIVIFKDLPVIQCTNCREILIDDPIMEKVDLLLKNIDSKAELEIIQFAA